MSGGPLKCSDVIMITGPNNKILSGRRIINTKVATWVEGDIKGSNGASFLNSANATLILSNGGNWLGNGTISNAGSIFKYG